MATRKTHVVENGKIVPSEFHSQWTAHPSEVREDHKKQRVLSGMAQWIRPVRAVFNTKKKAFQWLDDYAAGLVEYHEHPSGKGGQWSKDPYGPTMKGTG
jgi:hypothetical protein